MPHFTYTARMGAQLQRGTQEGANPLAVAAILRGRGLAPVTITATRRELPGQAEGGLLSAWRRPRVSLLELMLFSRQLHTLLRSGVPILRALACLQESATAAQLRHTIQQLRQSLESGFDFATSLAQAPEVFSHFYVALTRVGEMTGRLDEVLMRLYEHLEFEMSMAQQVRAATRYPMFVCIAMAVAIGVINVMVIPAFDGVFKSLGAELPLPTRMLVATSNFTLHYGWLLGLLAIGAGLGWRRWRATPTGRYCWDRQKLRLPLAGKIIRKATLARMARALALSLKSGVPVEQALSVVAATVDNLYMQRKVEKIRETVERGESILRAAAASGVFTPVVLQMLAVGEETGALDELLDEVGLLYTQEVQYEYKTLGQQIEPILICCLGGLVLILALGVFLPVWDLGRVSFKH